MNDRLALTTPLVGPRGEAVVFLRTISGHGVTSLAPMTVDVAAGTLHVTLALPNAPARQVTIRSDGPAAVRIDLIGPEPLPGEPALVVAAVRHILRLEQDLSGFYALAARDPLLAWATTGAGRMTRCQTVFEDVVKTICTTNCAWSATVRMVNALVMHLGEPAPGASDDHWLGRAFPTPRAMADADEAFYREVGRCGYRGGYLKKLATAVAEGELDLEALGTTSADDLPDEQLAKQLMALPGVGPYAAAHIMTMLGRYTRLVFDSWTRPTFAKLVGRESVTDAEIVERFSPYGSFAGLAFWLTITNGWIDSADAQEVLV